MSDSVVGALIGAGIAGLGQLLALLFMIGRFVGKVTSQQESFSKSCQEKHQAVDNRLTGLEDRERKHLEAHTSTNG